jgi:hypothetical protein
MPLHPRELVRRFNSAPDLRARLKDAMEKAIAGGQPCFSIADLPGELERLPGFDLLIAEHRLRLLITYSTTDDGHLRLRCLHIDDLSRAEHELPEVQFNEWGSFALPNSSQGGEHLEHQPHSGTRLLRHLMLAAGVTV